jgi:hypothetical protein
MITKTPPPEVEDPDIKKMLALWERLDRLYWRRTLSILIGLAVGIAVANIIAILLIAFYLFLQTH